MADAVPMSSELDLSVVVPVKDEALNVGPLAEEIATALEGRYRFEMIFVDDGSEDETAAKLAETRSRLPTLRIIRHRVCRGQSIAILSGVAAAHGPLIATLDGDGQNDPADIPALLERYNNEHGLGGPVLIAGWRAKRNDIWLKRVSSKIANAVRGALLGDRTPDTGCGLKIFARDDFLRYPAFNHMHRFLPALTIRAGGRVVSVEVNHRPRARGMSKYGLFNRLGIGIVDLVGVAWLQRRSVRAEFRPEDPS
ncbi:MAG: glycosyltransferase [Proteobacteria bacterium]|nr:glycosyltransferase [Pseudomonadota bacterium]